MSWSCPAWMHSPLPAGDITFCREHLFWGSSQLMDAPLLKSPEIPAWRLGLAGEPPKTFPAISHDLNPRELSLLGIDPVSTRAGSAFQSTGHFLCLKRTGSGKVGGKRRPRHRSNVNVLISGGYAVMAPFRTAQAIVGGPCQTEREQLKTNSGKGRSMERILRIRVRRLWG
jgi:hypothetical protein